MKKEIEIDADADLEIHKSCYDMGGSWACCAPNTSIDVPYHEHTLKCPKNPENLVSEGNGKDTEVELPTREVEQPDATPKKNEPLGMEAKIDIILERLDNIETMLDNIEVKPVLKMSFAAIKKMLDK